MAFDIGTNLGSATVTTGGTDAPAAGTQETFIVSGAINIPAAVSGLTQFSLVDSAQYGNPALAEVMVCTNVNGASWTVLRASEVIGSNAGSPVAHLANWTAVVVKTQSAISSTLGNQPAKIYPLGTGGSTTVSMPPGYSVYNATIASGVSTPYTLPHAFGGEEYTWTATNASTTFPFVAPVFSAYAGDALTWITGQPDWLTGSSQVNQVLFKAVGAGSVNAYAITSAAGPALGVMDEVETVTGGSVTLVLPDPALTGITRNIINLSAGSVTPLQYPVPAIGKWLENVYVQPSTGAPGSVSYLAPIGWYGGGVGNTVPALSSANGLRDVHRYNSDDGATWTGRVWTGAPVGSLISIYGSGWSNTLGASTTGQVLVNPASAGHMLVLSVPIYYYNHAIVDFSSVSGGGVTTWHEAAPFATISGSSQTSVASTMWWGIVTSPGSASITATFPSANGGGLLNVYEFATSAGTFSQDGAGASVSGDNVASITIPTLTPSAPNELCIITSYNVNSIGIPSGYLNPGGAQFYYNANVSVAQALTLSATSGNMSAVAALIKV